MTYILFFAFHYWATGLWLLTKGKSFLTGGIFLVGATLLFVRDSGTDVRNYEAIIRYLWDLGLPDAFRFGIEPGFVLLSMLLGAITRSEVLALRIVGFVFTGILFLFFLRGVRSERLFLLLYFLPAFYLSYGMNAVRAGLGVALFLLGWQLWRRRKTAVASFFWFLATLTHYSTLFLVFVMLLEKMSNLNRSRGRFGSFLLLVVLGSLSVVVGLDWLRDKAELYASPSQFVSFTSGLSHLIALALLILSLFFSKATPLKSKIFISSSWLFLSLCTWIVGWLTSSYAFLRILDLIRLALPLYLIQHFEASNRKVPRSFWFFAFMAGLVGTLFFYKNALVDFGGAVTELQPPSCPSGP